MALDMSKYKKMAKVERKLPIIFMINEKIVMTEKWEGGQYKGAIMDIMRNLSHRGIDAVMSVVSFGTEVSLWSGFKKCSEYTEKEWPQNKTEGKSVFNIALTLVKDMLEDIDTTPEGNYDPIVVFITNDDVSPGYKKELEIFLEDGRFKNIQRIGIADWYYDSESFTAYGITEGGINRHTPEVLREFAKKNVVLYVEDRNYNSWCVDTSKYGHTETKYDYSWYCPVIELMELRYTEDGQQYVNKIN